MKKLILPFICLFSFTALCQAPLTTIPFERYGDHLFIKVSVDDSEPLDFIFDSGDGITVIDRDVAENLHLVKKEVVLNEESIYGAIIKHNTIEIDGFLIEKNIKVYATDLDHLEISLGREFDGIIGYDLLRHHSVRIDYDNHKFEIYDLGVHPKKGTPVPFKLVNSIPTVEGSVVLNNDEPHDGSFFVMTGAGTTLDFNSPYAVKYDVIHKTGKHFSYFVKNVSKKETKHYEGHVKSFTFGNQTLTDLPIGISLATSGMQAHKHVAGIIGNEILSKFNIIIDLPSKTLYLEKNKSFDEELVINCSGIDVQLSEDKKKVLIHQVYENSPASEAGIKVNAELLSINGKSTKDLKMQDVIKMFKKEGETVELLINQDGAEKKVTLKLRSLI
ncbi:MAG: PDZ domain-containing protein [Cyclobacteriaceae bacterium]